MTVMGKDKKIYSHVLFDLDGTLTDPGEGIIKCVQYALMHFDIDEHDVVKLRLFIGPPLKDSFMKYYGFSEAQAVEAIEKYRERYRSAGIFESRLYDGIETMLKSLKDRGGILAVATTKPAVFAEQIIKMYGLDGYFTFVSGSELDGRRTDKAEVIRYALDHIGSPDISMAVMVGDRKHDIIGAQKCGISSVAVRFGYAETGELESAGPDYIVDTVEELRELLV